MYEYHGWISIKESCNSALKEKGSIEFILEKISSLIEKFSTFPGICKVYFVNGNCHISVGGFSNHSPRPEDSIACLYETLSCLSRESYGLLHIRDDEDPDFQNDFKVLILKKGQITQSIDPFLSPCIPTIEEAAAY